MIQATGLLANQICLKCGGDMWPCVIFSSSFQSAKVVSNTKTGLLAKLKAANNAVSLKFSFKAHENKSGPLTFFVNARAAGYNFYGNSEDVAIFTLQFAQRPPDDLIEINGKILDASVNSSKRIDERIIITPDSIRKLSITAKENDIIIQGVPRHCILRDVSFSGAKLIMMGVAKFLIDKDVVLKINFDDPAQTYSIKGKIIRTEAVDGRKELVALAINFDASVIPIAYKIRINNFLASNKGSKDIIEVKSDTPAFAMKPVQPKAAPAAKPAASAPAAAAKPAAQAPAAAAKPAEPTGVEVDDAIFDLDFPGA
jgi:hypothetical protein